MILSVLLLAVSAHAQTRLQTRVAPPRVVPISKFSPAAAPRPGFRSGPQALLRPVSAPRSLLRPRVELAVPAAPLPLAALPDLKSLSVRLAVPEAPGSELSSKSELDAAFFHERRLSGSVEPSRAGFSRPQALAAPTPSEPKQASVPAPRAPGPIKRALPNLITGLNLASGLGALLLASQGLILPAAGLIVLANVFDLLDGRVARALGVASPIGIQLDSLADVVSFGAAPALLIFHAALAPLGPAGFAVAAAFAFAGAYRLARFNVGAQAAEGKPSAFFTGLPIPGGAGVIAAMAIAAPLLAPAYLVPIAVAVTLLTAGAMVSRLPYPAFKTGGAKGLVPLAAFAVAASAGLFAAGLPILIPAAIFGAYALTGPLVWLYQGGSDLFKRELKRKAFHQGLLLYIPAYFLIGFPAIVPAVLGWTALVGALEWARLKIPAARPLYEKLFGGIIREKEAHRFSGSFFGALGLGISIALFGSNPAIVVASVLYLALGDATSPLVGMRFGVGRYTVGGTLRSVDGTLAGFAVAIAIGLATGFPLWIALGAALAFSVVDTIPVKPDDNFWIPIVGAAVLFLLGLF